MRTVHLFATYLAFIWNSFLSRAVFILLYSRKICSCLRFLTTVPTEIQEHSTISLKNIALHSPTVLPEALSSCRVHWMYVQTIQNLEHLNYYVIPLRWMYISKPTTVLGTSSMLYSKPSLLWVKDWKADLQKDYRQQWISRIDMYRSHPIHEKIDLFHQNQEIWIQVAKLILVNYSSHRNNTIWPFCLAHAHFYK